MSKTGSYFQDFQMYIMNFVKDVITVTEIHVNSLGCIFCSFMHLHDLFHVLLPL